MSQRVLQRLRPESRVEWFLFVAAIVVGVVFMVVASVDGSWPAALLIVGVLALLTVAQRPAVTIIDRGGFQVGFILTSMTAIGATIGRVVASLVT